MYHKPEPRIFVRLQSWTEMGGEILFIEATLLPGGSGLTLTGQLGEVMQESARAARSYLWSHAAEFGISPEMFKRQYANVGEKNEQWNAIPVMGGELFSFDSNSTYVQEPPFFIDLKPEPVKLGPETVGADHEIQGVRIWRRLKIVQQVHIDPGFAGEIPN